MVKLKKKENLVARNEIKVEDSQENKINNNYSNKSDKLNPYKVFIKKTSRVYYSW